MPATTQLPLQSAPQSDLTLINPGEVIDAMIDLRIQVDELKRQMDALEPAFFAACASLNMDKIVLERAAITATITRRLTPGHWDYSLEILDQETLLKQLRQEFQKINEPTRGREITWAIKLLFALA